jgi:5-methylcytosine-specific restriction enzyme A
MKNPPWNNEELILALNLYFHLEYGQMDGRNPQVKILSDLLTTLNEPNGFSRSVNSVSIKLANFKRIDPEFKGKGMIGGGKLEESIWGEYYQNKQLLNTIANEIRNKILNSRMELSLADEECESLTEGRRKVYISQKIERDIRLRSMAIKIHGTSCKACGFNFGLVYGEWGKDFIEVHHLVPLGNNEVNERNTDPVKDLIVLCSNCHRMVHRKKGITLTLEELKQKINPALK